MIQRKKSCNHLDSNPQPLECNTGTLPVELQFSEECSSRFLYTFAFNSLCRANGSTYEDAVTKLEYTDDEHFYVRDLMS